MKDEATLLRRYAEEGSQAAFSELVRRHVDLVYGAALRRTGGDTYLAADAAQQVFISLARNARRLARHPALSAWLHTATRNAVLNLVISEQRRKAREQTAFALEPGAITDVPDWAQVRPVLDAAIDELPESDRTAVVWRFLERRPFAEIGAALQVTEDAARMRTERALEKLRAALARRGVTSTAAALGAIVAAQPLVSAPAGLAATFATAALAAATSTTGLLTGITVFMNTKLVTAGVSALVAFGLGLYFGQDRRAAPPLPTVTENPQHLQAMTSLREENQRLTATIARLDGEIGNLKAATASTSVSAATPASAASSMPVTTPLLIDARLLAFQQQRAILNNLFQIAGARNQFRKAQGRLPSSIDEMVGEKKYIRQVRPVDGEDYSTLQFGDGQKLTVTTTDGVTATVDLATGQPEGVLVSPAVELAKELARQMEPATKKATEAFRAANNGAEPKNPQALLPFFTSPQERADYTDYLEAVKVARVN